MRHRIITRILAQKIRRMPTATVLGLAFPGFGAGSGVPPEVLASDAQSISAKKFDDTVVSLSFVAGEMCFR